MRPRGRQGKASKADRPRRMVPPRRQTCKARGPGASGEGAPPRLQSQGGPLRLRRRLRGRSAHLRPPSCYAVQGRAIGRLRTGAGGAVHKQRRYGAPCRRTRRSACTQTKEPAVAAPPPPVATVQRVQARVGGQGLAARSQQEPPPRRRALSGGATPGASREPHTGPANRQVVRHGGPRRYRELVHRWVRGARGSGRRGARLRRPGGPWRLPGPPAPAGGSACRWRAPIPSATA